MEVEYITLLERDRINFEEGREEEKIQMAKKLLVRGMSIYPKIRTNRTSHIRKKLKKWLTCLIWRQSHQKR